MKRPLILIISCFFLFSPLAYAQLYKCEGDNGKIEFTDRPCIDEKQEIVNVQSTVASPSSSDSPAVLGTKAFMDGTIRYYDSLKNCSPYTFTYESFLADGQNKIVGRKNDKCHVIMTTGDYTFNCNFSAETIATLTSEEKYEEARTNNYKSGADLTECI